MRGRPSHKEATSRLLGGQSELTARDTDVAILRQASIGLAIYPSKAGR
jgi:hypothetical protein